MLPFTRAQFLAVFVADNEASHRRAVRLATQADVVERGGGSLYIQEAVESVVPLCVLGVNDAVEVNAKMHFARLMLGLLRLG